MGLSGITQIKAICRALECRPRTLYIVDCPICDTLDVMELDPKAGTYWCGSCGRRGKLGDLAVLAEGVFLNKHRTARRCMETRPGVTRGGGGRR